MKYLIIIFFLLLPLNSFSNNNGIIISKNRIENDTVLENIDMNHYKLNFIWPDLNEIKNFPKVINRRDISKIKRKNKSVEYLKQISKVPLSPKDVCNDCSNWLKSFIFFKKYLPDNLKENMVLQQSTPSKKSRVLLKYNKHGFNIQVIFTISLIYIVIDPPEEFVKGLVNEEIFYKIFREVFKFGQHISKHKIIKITMLDNKTKIFEVRSSLIGATATRYWFLQNKKIGFTLYKCFSSSTVQSDTGVWF